MGERWITPLYGAVLAAVVCLSWTLSWTGARADQVGAAPVTANPLEGRSDLVDDGRSLFNQYCAHCHGPNAVQGERPRDLRRLKLRYGGGAPRAFYESVSRGRLDKGMPVWKGVLSDDVLWRIFTYLETVQSEP